MAREDGPVQPQNIVWDPAYCGRCHRCSHTIVRNTLDGSDWCSFCNRGQRPISHGFKRNDGGQESKCLTETQTTARLESLKHQPIVRVFAGGAARAQRAKGADIVDALIGRREQVRRRAYMRLLGGSTISNAGSTDTSPVEISLNPAS